MVLHELCSDVDEVLQRSCLSKLYFLIDILGMLHVLLIDLRHVVSECV